MASLRLVMSSLIAAAMLVFAPAAHAIVDGTPTSGADTPVVFVGQLRPPGEPRNACTGVAVSPRIVVTAAHCGVLPDGSLPANQPFAILKGPSIFAPTFVTGGVFIPHPGFTCCGHGLPDFWENDLAVVLITGPPLPGPYAQLPELGFVDTLRGNVPLLLEGYGVSELHGHTLDPSSFGTLRRAGAKLLGGGANRNFLHFNGPACRGDSGGGVMYGNIVIGVVSFAPSACRSTNYATRLDTESARSFLSNPLFGLTLP